MFVKSTRFKQVCQLLLSRIVAINQLQETASTTAVLWVTTFGIYTTLGIRYKAKHRATATYFPCDLWNVKMSWEYAVEPCFTDTS